MTLHTASHSRSDEDEYPVRGVHSRTWPWSFKATSLRQRLTLHEQDAESVAEMSRIND